jgi:hypothetical protein
VRLPEGAAPDCNALCLAFDQQPSKLVLSTDPFLDPHAQRCLSKHLALVDRLQHLSLDGTCLGPTGLSAIVEGILANSMCPLTTLVLTRTDLRPADGAALGRLLARNTSLVNVDASHNLLGTDGIVDVIDPLLDNPKSVLRMLNLSYNRVASVDLHKLETVLTMHQALQINLLGNPIRTPSVPPATLPLEPPTLSCKSPLEADLREGRLLRPMMNRPNASPTRDPSPTGVISPRQMGPLVAPSPASAFRSFTPSRASGSSSTPGRLRDSDSSPSSPTLSMGSMKSLQSLAPSKAEDHTPGDWRDPKPQAVPELRLRSAEQAPSGIIPPTETYLMTSPARTFPLPKLVVRHPSVVPSETAATTAGRPDLATAISIPHRNTNGSTASQSPSGVAVNGGRLPYIAVSAAPRTSLTRGDAERRSRSAPQTSAPSENSSRASDPITPASKSEVGRSSSEYSPQRCTANSIFSHLLAERDVLRQDLTMTASTLREVIRERDALRAEARGKPLGTAPAASLDGKLELLRRLDPVVADAVGRELHSRLDRLLGAVQAGQPSAPPPRTSSTAPSPAPPLPPRPGEPGHPAMAAYRLSPRLSAVRTVLLSTPATRQRETTYSGTPPAPSGGNSNSYVSSAPDEDWAEPPPPPATPSRASHLSVPSPRAPRRSSTGSVGGCRRPTAAPAPPMTPEKPTSNRTGQPLAGADDWGATRSSGTEADTGHQPHRAGVPTTSNPTTTAANGRRTRSLPSSGVTGGTRRVAHAAPRLAVAAVANDRMPSPGMQRVRQY